MPSVPRTIWESFLRVALPVMAVCGFALGYLKFADISPNWPTPLYVVAGVLSVALLAICTLAEPVYRSQRATRPLLPAIMTVRSETGPLSGSGIMCLLEPSELFSAGMSVSFYWLDNTGFEVQIGLGQITTVQEDGKIQVALVSPAESQQDVLIRMANNDRTVLDKIRIRPYISFQAILASE